MPVKKYFLAFFLTIFLVLLSGILLNALTYPAKVKIQDQQNAIIISRSKTALDFGSIPPNNSVTRFIELENNESFGCYIFVLKTGEISRLIKSESGVFALNPGEKKVVSFELKVPVSAKEKEYKGKVSIIRFPKLI